MSLTLFSSTVFIHKFSRQQCTTVVAMSALKLLSWAAVSLVALTSGDEDVPAPTPPCVHRADVATSYYTATAQAIQQATTNLRLHVVIPTVTDQLCIAMCASSSLCAPLHSRVADAVSKSTFTGTNQRLDTFVAGHSMGSVCANNLVYGYSLDCAGMMAFVKKNRWKSTPSQFSISRDSSMVVARVQASWLITTASRRAMVQPAGRTCRCR